VAFATASGFAVVQSAVCPAPESESPPIKAQPNAGRAKDQPVRDRDSETA
jgi:hypothetical protein